MLLNFAPSTKPIFCIFYVIFYALVLADSLYLFYALLQSIIVKEFLPHLLRTMEMISLAHTLLISVCFLL